LPTVGQIPSRWFILVSPDAGFFPNNGGKLCRSPRDDPSQAICGQTLPPNWRLDPLAAGRCCLGSAPKKNPWWACLKIGDAVIPKKIQYISGRKMMID